MPILEGVLGIIYNVIKVCMHLCKVHISARRLIHFVLRSSSENDENCSHLLVRNLNVVSGQSRQLAYRVENPVQRAGRHICLYFHRLPRLVLKAGPCVDKEPDNDTGFALGVLLILRIKQLHDDRKIYDTHAST